MSPFIEKTLAVAAGGAFGAVGRYWISGWISRVTAQHPFPFGTLSVNLIGALALGVIMGATTSGRFLISPTVRILLTIGCLGALTTFSTFAYETLEALRAGDFRIALANVGISVVVGLFVAWLGINLGERM
ncbi:MAG: fluoride efflux transporter CrcB [Acidobacteriota bacterium]